MTATNKMKICKACKQPLPLSSFFKDHSRSDLYCRKCKSCDYERHNDKNRNRYRTSEKRLSKQIRYVQKFPERQAAREKLVKAVAAGKIARMPCEVCGKVKAHGHYDDYSKPYEVRWLCPTHHKEIHNGKL